MALMSNFSDSTDADWSLAEFEVGELTYWTRWRPQSVIPHPDRPSRIIVKFIYSTDRADGLPSDETIEELDAVEGVLARELAEFGADLVLVLTGNSAREFIAYGPSAEFLDGYGPTILARWAEVGIGRGIEAGNDPNWESFQRFTP